MRPINVTQRRRFEQTKAVVAPKPSQSSNRVPTEFLRELQSAASMIMSREECEEMAREFEHMYRPRIVAA
jgi:hypothetical protein